MSEIQQSIYQDALQRSRKTILDELSSGDESEALLSKSSKPSKKKARLNGQARDKKYLENSSNVLMDLRKAASHPMLFRTLFTDTILSGIAKQLLKEPDFRKRGALFNLVKEDMSVMTDAELQVFCATYKVRRILFSFVSLSIIRCFSVYAQVPSRREVLPGRGENPSSLKVTRQI